LPLLLLVLCENCDVLKAASISCAVVQARQGL
jgi:hypothetical protein